MALEAVCSKLQKAFPEETVKEALWTVQKKKENNREEILVSCMNQHGVKGLRVRRICCYSRNNIKINKRRDVCSKHIWESL